jgi:hypothetical protein
MNAPSEFWKNWTRETGTLRWRLALPSDLPAIAELRKASERLTDQVQRDPDLFSTPVLLTLVAEDKDGKLVDALYAEVEIELIKIGMVPEAFGEVALLQQDLSAWLQSIGIRTVLVTTLPSHKQQMGATLETLGFECTDGEFSHFKRNL